MKTSHDERHAVVQSHSGLFKNQNRIILLNGFGHIKHDPLAHHHKYRLFLFIENGIKKSLSFSLLRSTVLDRSQL